MRLLRGHIVFFSMLLCLCSRGQSPASRSCRIIDSLTNQSVADARYFVLSGTDTLAAGPANGSLSIPCGQWTNKTAVLKIVHPAYEPKLLVVDSAFCQGELAYLIRLRPLAKEMQSVVIRSDEGLIRQDIDKITYNVAADPDSKTRNLLDIMPKLPFVTLSPDDQPLLQGKGTFIVLLNGRRTGLFSSRNLRDALKGIPASSVARIEVLTDPPPRFESEGVTGVINIITLKRPGDGYNGSVNLSAGTFISGANGSLNFRRNKFGVTILGGATLERTPFNSLFSETTGQDFRIVQNGESKVNHRSWRVGSLFSYELDSLNLVTLEAGLSTGELRNWVNLSAESNTGLVPLPGRYRSALDRNVQEEEGTVNLNYQRIFRRFKGRLLTLSYVGIRTGEEVRLTNELVQKQNYDGANYRQHSNAGQNDHAVQLDYVHPLRKLRIEAGAKYISRDIFNDFSTQVYDPVSGSVFPDTSNTNNLDYRLSVMGLYNTYILTLKSFSIRGGFRLEQTKLDGDFTQKYHIEQDYLNLLPSVKLQYKSKKGGIYSLGMRQQIQRPGVGLLNPIVIRSAPGFGSSGNSNLKPVLLSSYSAGFSRFKEGSTSFILSYAFSRNSIQSVSSLVGDSLVLTRFENIGRYQRLGIENSTEIPLGEHWDGSLDGSLFYVKVDGGKDALHLSNQGVEGFIYSYVTYRLQNYRFTANLGFYGPTVNVQARSNSYLYSSVGISRVVLKKMGTVSLRVANPFQQYRRIRSEVNTPELVQTLEQKNLFRGFYLSFNYRFGKLKEEVKRNKRSLLIDDAARETGKIN